MIQPDSSTILQFQLCLAGFSKYSDLGRKSDIFYKRISALLSKQPHYDFGLRNKRTLVRMCSTVKRMRSTADETELVRTELENLFKSKLVDEDKSIFMQLLQDIFPR